ncbi:MAG: aminotransferase class I/II-fold pyridoxal phosphate-dependent enzyme [Magnetococcus sp. DMHC-6]
MDIIENTPLSAANTQQLQKNLEAFKQAYDQAGTHSPSLAKIRALFPDLQVHVDACFIGNPYATEIFEAHLRDELFASDRLYHVLRLYPSQNRGVAEVLAQRLRVCPKKLFIGNGATEIIQMLLQRFSGPRVLVNLPTFSSYYEFLESHQTAIFNYLPEEKNFALDIDHLAQLAEEEQADTVILINPNNPDGGFLNPQQMDSCLKRLQNIPLVIVDESFIHFASPKEGNPYDLSIIHQLDRYPNVVLVKSMSKDLGIAGARLGYTIMPEAWVNTILEKGYLWNISCLAETIIGLYNQEKVFNEYLQARHRYMSELELFMAGLQRIPGLRTVPSKTNFALVKITDGRTSTDIVGRMLFEFGVYIRDCRDKKGLYGEYLRISSGTKEENHRTLNALEEIFAPRSNRILQRIPGQNRLSYQKETIRMEFENYSLTSSDYDSTRIPIGLELILGQMAMNAKPISQQSLLDAGCGTGNYLASLAPKVGSLVGMEKNPAMLERARHKLTNFTNVSVQEGDITAMNFAPELFDSGR